MIRRDNHDRDVQSNQQPVRNASEFMSSPVRRIARSRSLDLAKAQVERAIGAPHQKQNRKMSLSVKSDAPYVSPTKSSAKFSIKSESEIHGKSPTSVFEVESPQSAFRDSAATSSSVSKSLRSLKDQPEIHLEGLNEHEEQEIELESSYFLDLGSIPSSFRISSSNFSTRSDITGLTVFEPLDETSVGASLLTSPDAAPLRPERQSSQNNLSLTLNCGEISSLKPGRNEDHRPTQPSRQSSRRFIGNRARTNSMATNRSSDSSPCKPIRQKSVATLLENTSTERGKLQCPSIDSSPPAKPQRKHSMRSLVHSISSSDDTTHRQHQSIPLHESILEEPSLSEHCE